MTDDSGDLSATLSRFDSRAHEAVDFLISRLSTSRPELVALARGRHVWGHYRYGDANFAEYDKQRLLAEASEELADAIVYISRYLSSRNGMLLIPGGLGNLGRRPHRR